MLGTCSCCRRWHGLTPGTQIQPSRATSLLWSYAPQGFTAALSPRCEPISLTPPWKVDALCLPLLQSLAAHHPGTRVKNKVRRPGRRTVPGTKTQVCQIGTGTKPKESKNVGWHCRGGHGSVAWEWLATWDGQQQWAWPGQHRATCSLSPTRGRWPEGSFQSSTAIQGLLAMLGVRTSTIYLG